MPGIGVQKTAFYETSEEEITGDRNKKHKFKKEVLREGENRKDEKIH